jgi:hypothetical protein
MAAHCKGIMKSSWVKQNTAMHEQLTKGHNFCVFYCESDWGFHARDEASRMVPELSLQDQSRLAGYLRSNSNADGYRHASSKYA